VAIVIGLISDTHGLLRPQVAAALSGVDLILHAGDVGRPTLLDELRSIAPVRAVHGNVDAPGPGLPAIVDLQLEGVSIHVSHGHEVGAPTPEKLFARYSADVIVYGHTHRALISRTGPRLAVNPGAAGPRRFNIQPSVGRLTIAAGRCDAELIWLT
jgi:putative phosphoesterase